MSILPINAALTPATKTLDLFWQVPAKSGTWEVERMDDAGAWKPTGLFVANNSAHIRGVSFGFDGTEPLFTIPRITQRP
jgi:hypothetical protein